jgi:CubicO group peptidase (beta-lactamase class C family)
VLAEVIQKVSGKLLEEYVYQVNVQIGIRNTNYAPSTDLYHVAPTAVIPGKGLLVGKAFDPMSYLYNSTTGHAGIFSSATDTLRLFRLLLAGGQLDSEARMFQKATVDIFTTKPTNLKYNNSRAYIFDTVPNDDPNPPCGKKFTPEKNFGLYGQTGVMAWADKTKDVAIVILTNAMYPLGQSKVKDLFPKLSDEIMTQLGY